MWHSIKIMSIRLLFTLMYWPNHSHTSHFFYMSFLWRWIAWWDSIYWCHSDGWAFDNLANIHQLWEPIKQKSTLYHSFAIIWYKVDFVNIGRYTSYIMHLFYWHKQILPRYICTCLNHDLSLVMYMKVCVTLVSGRKYYRVVSCT